MNNNMHYIFLLYQNRSGSSFVLQQLSKSPDICVCPESDALFELLIRHKKIPSSRVKTWAHKIISDFKFKLWGISIHEVESILLAGTDARKAFFGLLDLFRQKHAPLSRVIIYKHTDLDLYISQLASAGRQVKFLSLIRDPRAVFMSQHRAWLKPYNRYMTYCAFWFSLRYARFISNIFYLEPAQCQILYYRNIIRFFPSCCASVAEFFDVPLWELDVRGTYQSVIPGQLSNLHMNIDQLPDESRIGAWQNEINPLQVRVIQFFGTKAMRQLKLKAVRPKQPIRLSHVSGELRAFAMDTKFILVQNLKRYLNSW